jgi:hypothetical protein
VKNPMTQQCFFLSYQYWHNGRKIESGMTLVLCFFSSRYLQTTKQASANIIGQEEDKRQKVIHNFEI